VKILIGIGFSLFILTLAICLVGDNEFLTPSSILGGSSLIALAIYIKK